MRSRKVDFRRAQKRLAHNEALFVWQKPLKPSAFLSADQWQSLPQEITVRLLRVTLVRRGFRTTQITLVTTLLDPILYPSAEIVAVHLRRWRLEMCLDDLKTTLGMENLHCRCPEMLKKELLVFLIAHNLVRWLMAQAARQGRVDLDLLSFKGSVDSLRQWSLALALHPAHRHRRIKLWGQLLKAITDDILPYRPGRKEPRAVKKRSKYPHLDRPRHQYRDRMSRSKRRRAATAKKHAFLN